jgi:uncharacterized repeat protein (TIGR01451 family)
MGGVLATVGNTDFYIDNTASGNNDYWVEAVGNATPVAANQNTTGTTPGASGSCGGGSGGPNLTTSDKDIIALNGSQILYSGLPPQSCNASTDVLPSSISLNSTDVLTFQINLCNTGGQSATSVSVSDTMTNMQQVPGSANWGALYNGSSLTYDGSANSGLVDHYYVSGTAPNQTLTFKLSTPASPGNDIPAGSASTLTITGQLIAPQNTGSNIVRFSNSFTANFSSTQTVVRSTPLLPFFRGKGSPTINEVP